MKLKTAKQIIDGFPSHLKRKHKGRREVSPRDIEDAQVTYLQKHLEAYQRAGLLEGITNGKALR